MDQMDKNRKRALLLINGSAGVAQMAKETYHILEMLALAGYEVTAYPILPGEGFGSEEILAKESEPFALVVCAGGDGTLMHVVNGIMKLPYRPVIGYIPAGSTNDFAYSLGIPGRVDEALQVIVKGRPFRYDIGSFNGRYFNYVAAFGAFVAVTYTTDQSFKNVFGHAAYVLNGISTFGQSVSYKCHMRIRADELEVEDDYVFGLVYNTTSVGGIHLLESANVRLDDGKFGLLLIRAPENLADAGQIIQDFIESGQDTGRRGNAVLSESHPYVLSLKGVSHLEVDAPEGAAWTLDGEYGGEPEHVVIDVVPGAMEIMVPESE